MIENASDNTQKLICSIGVIAYNEAGNIIKLLQSLCNQKLSRVEIAEVIVVSSACTDGTDDLVSEFATTHPQVSLICQKERKGKSSAINLFLQKAKSEILIIESGDTIPAADTIEKLVLPFKDRKIGATGGRPVPVNDENTVMGYAVHLLWRMHHRMALISPKLGEMIAFRKLFDSIPTDSAVDEASIEAIVRAKGYKLKYVPDAVIYNKGPETWRDFVKQRRRIQNGHLWLKQKYHYKVASQESGLMLKIFWQELKERPLQIFKLFLAMLMEAYCRILGSYDFYVKKKNPFAWEISSSTKNLNSKE
ncbi:MAG TPA: glycosyltransferase [Candidatus Cloacimonadota bacterium]|nr:glycosyltransferase [Candidatus Cloacimonadota bacterium]HOV17298.1 glycosyltransferase [Candidatus Cloacimonadota bacterium]HQL15614.1 glycosyltransferase [Candidatus Cloacimonadota bacterium]